MEDDSSQLAWGNRRASQPGIFLLVLLTSTKAENSHGKEDLSLDIHQTERAALRTKILQKTAQKASLHQQVMFNLAIAINDRVYDPVSLRHDNTKTRLVCRMRHEISPPQARLTDNPRQILLDSDNEDYKKNLVLVLDQAFDVGPLLHESKRFATSEQASDVVGEPAKCYR